MSSSSGRRANQGFKSDLDFAARESCTVGGIVACNAGGARALRYGTAHARVVGSRRLPIYERIAAWGTDACGPPVLGAIQARQKNDPFSRQLLLVGFDALPDEAKAIVASDEIASVAQFPQKMGTTAVTTAADAARGKDVSARIDTGTEIVTKANAEKFTTFQ